MTTSRPVPDGKGSIFSWGVPRNSGTRYGSRRVHDVWQLRAPSFPLCHPHRQCHDLHPSFPNCFEWSLLFGKSCGLTQTWQRPILSTHSTVGHLGRSVESGSGSGGAALGRRWRFSCVLWWTLCRRGQRRCRQGRMSKRWQNTRL